MVSFNFNRTKKPTEKRARLRCFKDDQPLMVAAVDNKLAVEAISVKELKDVKFSTRFNVLGEIVIDFADIEGLRKFEAVVETLRIMNSLGKDETNIKGKLLRLLDAEM